MRITVFAKKRTTTEGKKFYTYLATLTKKDGTEVTTAVKFGEDCGTPKADECPMNIDVDKVNANFSTKHIVLDDGREIESNTLWVKDWTKSAEVYRDASMDDFE